MKRKHLYAVAAVIWGIPGITITLKGISAYGKQPSEDLWWLLLTTASVLAAFFMMFRRIVNRYCGRIPSLPAKVKIWQTFPARGWILIVFMMGLCFCCLPLDSWLIWKLTAKFEFKCKSRGLETCLHTRGAALNARETGIYQIKGITLYFTRVLYSL